MTNLDLFIRIFFFFFTNLTLFGVCYFHKKVPFQETDQQVTPQAEVFRAKGSTLSSESRDVEAVLSYNESISLSPHSSVLYRERAAALLKRNWIGDVEAAFR